MSSDSNPVVMSEQKYYVHPSSYVDDGVSIGDGTKIWHFCHIMPNAVVGNGCNIGQNVFYLLIIYKFTVGHCLSPFERLRLKGNKVRNLSVAFICLVSRLLGRKPYISVGVS